MMAPKDPQNVLDSKLWILQVPRSIDWTCFVVVTHPSLTRWKLLFSPLFSAPHHPSFRKKNHFDSRTEVMTVSYVKIVCGMFFFYEGNNFFLLLRPSLTRRSECRSLFHDGGSDHQKGQWSHTLRASDISSPSLRTIMWKSAHKKILIHRLLSSTSSLPVVWCAYQL